MLDVRRPEDTVFIAAKQDYRFYLEGCVEDWYGVVADDSRPGLDQNMTVIMEGRPEPPSLAPAAEPPSPSPAEEAPPEQKQKQR